MTKDCPYCGEPYLNFGKFDAEMGINEQEDGRYIICVPYAWSIPINHCPFCGRKLEKVKVDAD